MKKTQKQRILEELQDANGEWVNTQFFKRTLWITECNGRLSELKNDGYKIETSPFTDEYGFRSHRLLKEPKQESLL